MAKQGVVLILRNNDDGVQARVYAVGEDEVDDAVFAAILLVIMLFFPDGLLRAPAFRNLLVLPQKLSAAVRSSKSQESGDG